MYIRCLLTQTMFFVCIFIPLLCKQLIRNSKQTQVEKYCLRYSEMFCTNCYGNKVSTYGLFIAKGLGIFFKKILPNRLQQGSSDVHKSYVNFVVHIFRYKFYVILIYSVRISYLFYAYTYIRYNLVRRFFVFKIARKLLDCYL